MTTRKLDRLTPTNSAGIAFQRLWQRVCEQIEAQFGDLQTQITAVAAAQAAAAAADTKARAHMDDLPDIAISGDYSGTIDASQFPFDVAVKRFDGTTNVSSASTWTRTVESGDVSCTIDSATGVLTVTAISTDSIVRVESTKDGLTLRKKQAVTVQLSAPPDTGSASGATSWTDTTLSSINSTAMAQISDDLTVTVGASGTVDLSAPLKVATAASGPLASYTVHGRWQWWDGATWQDLGAAEATSSPDCTVFDANDGDTPTVYAVSKGSLTVPASKTGLAAGSSQKFHLVARNDSGTRAMTFTGTATASTS